MTKIPIKFTDYPLFIFFPPKDRLPRRRLLPYKVGLECRSFSLLPRSIEVNARLPRVEAWTQTVAPARRGELRGRSSQPDWHRCSLELTAKERSPMLIDACAIRSLSIRPDAVSRRLFYNEKIEKVNLFLFPFFFIYLFIFLLEFVIEKFNMWGLWNY